jgi:DNA polymerase III delta prime subunit
MKISVAELVDFAEAAMAADYTRLRKVGQLLVKEIEASDAEGARRLRSVLNRKGVPLQASGFTEMLPVDGKSRLPLVEEQSWPTVPVFLNAGAQEQFSSFLRDVENYELLASKGVASKLSLMLSGPPGTGKTLLAGHIASALGRKLYVVRLDSVISSMLGDTAKNIRSIFDFVAGKSAVLFLDELDAVAKMRDDNNELGELKRVVNTVIQGIDSLDERAVVIAATNHSQILDKAIWRRFSYKIEFSSPELDLRQELWKNFLDQSEGFDNSAAILATLSAGMSGAEIEQISYAARRLAILDDKPIDVVNIAANILYSVSKEDDPHEKNSDVRRRLARVLVLKHEVLQTNVARFLGVSRQAVSIYLK